MRKGHPADIGRSTKFIHSGSTFKSHAGPLPDEMAGQLELAGFMELATSLRTLNRQVNERAIRLAQATPQERNDVERYEADMKAFEQRDGELAELIGRAKELLK
jgi:hypothetical protein